MDKYLKSQLGPPLSDVFAYNLNRIAPIDVTCFRHDWYKIWPSYHVYVITIIDREINIYHRVIIPRQTISNLFYLSSRSEITSSSCPASDTSKLEKTTSGEKENFLSFICRSFPRKCNSRNPDLELVSMMPNCPAISLSFPLYKKRPSDIWWWCKFIVNQIRVFFTLLPNTLRGVKVLHYYTFFRTTSPFYSIYFTGL